MEKEQKTKKRLRHIAAQKRAALPCLDAVAQTFREKDKISIFPFSLDNPYKSVPFVLYDARRKHIALCLDINNGAKKLRNREEIEGVRLVF